MVHTKQEIHVNTNKMKDKAILEFVKTELKFRGFQYIFDDEKIMYVPPPRYAQRNYSISYKHLYFIFDATIRDVGLTVETEDDAMEDAFALIFDNNFKYVV